MAVSMCSSVPPAHGDQSVNSGSATTPGYLKRPLPETEVEFEPAAVKMRLSAALPGGGGGRRKQSKPIRVPSELDPTTPDEGLAISSLEVTLTQFSAVSSSTVDPHASDNNNTRENMDLDAVPVDPDDQNSEPSAAAAFPTKYHQLGSELKQEVALGSYLAEDGPSTGNIDELRAAPGPDMVDERRNLGDTKHSPPAYFDRRENPPNFLTEPPTGQFSTTFCKSPRMQDWASMSDCLPTNLSTRPVKQELLSICDTFAFPVRADATDLSRADLPADVERGWEGPDVGSAAGGGEKSRIFHPDAYCNICDREFCNKYFLKTHRANKHGIYDAESSAPTMVPEMSAMPQLSVSDTAAFSSASSALVPATLPIPQLPPGLPPMIKDEPSLPLPPPPPAPSARSSDMEDYCDICQKHFCNKYYLRKHRQDVHGLSPADAVARRTTAGSSESARDMTSSSTGASSSIPPPPLNLAGFPPMFLPPPFGSSLPVVPPFLPGAAALNFGGAFPSQFADTKPSVSQQHGPVTGSSLPPPPLPGVGLPYMDAYLELCRKELLGSYLLNSGDRDVAATFAAAASAAAATPGTPAEPAGATTPLRFPPVASSADAGGPAAADTSQNDSVSSSEPPTPDTFAEMLQRIGARIGRKPDAFGSGLHHDLFRLNGLNLGSGANRLSGSSNHGSTSTSSSRLVDRVVCDLCNKEVCNKYFLKTHKMKVHGWDPNTSTVPTTSASPSLASIASASNASTVATKLEPTVMSSTPLMFPPAAPLPPTAPAQHLGTVDAFAGSTPKDTELQQMGIDPEAYCEICRKEFCSKYFLRTHRQNIHGIRTDPPPSSSSSSSSPSAIQIPSNSLFPPVAPFSAISAAAPPPPRPPSPQASLPSSGGAAAAAAAAATSVALLFGSGDLGDVPQLPPAVPPLPLGSADAHRAWKWKEPINATRVSCTLCNKVLCNKYFLRTHMAKRHGVTVDTRLQPPQLPPSPLKDPTLTQQLPYISGTSRPTSPALVQRLAARTGDPVSDQKDESSSDSCGKPATSAAVNLVLGGRSADVQTVTARTWQVPADDVRQNGPADASSDGETGSRCPLCGVSAVDRDALVQHLVTVHHVNEQVSACLLDARPESTSPPSDAPAQGLQPVSQRSPSSLGGAVRRRRQFRCVYCRERFRTRVHCELHARAAHPRATGSCVEVTTALDPPPPPRFSPPPPTSATKFQTTTPNSTPPPIFATPLDADDAARAQMQPFVLRESLSTSSSPSSARFSTALVYLPTFYPVTAPTTVTFTLTPVIQP